MIRLPLLLLSLLLSIPALAGPADATSDGSPVVSDDALLLLEIRLDQQPLDDMVEAYSLDGRLFLPLGELCQRLGLAIEVDTEQGVAQGFVIDAEHDFFLDAGRHRVTIDGQPSDFPDSATIIHAGDILVSTTLLEAWLPLRLEADLYSLQLRVMPTRPLPMQQRMAREQKIRRARTSLVPEAATLPRRDTPHAAWRPPFIDLAFGIGWQHDAEGDSTTDHRYAIHATGELAYMDASARLAGDDEKPLRQHWLTLSRKSPDASLLGRLQAREFAVGHVSFPSVPLVTTASTPAPGLLVGSFPLTRQSLYDHHDFHGELPDGWDVELYRNNVLIDYQPASSDGRYRFDAVPLLLGHNFFHLVFHGPRGERREERQHFILSDALTRPGASYYRFIVSEDEVNGGLRSALQYHQSLSRWLSTRLALTTLGDDGQYFSAGLHGFANNLYGGVDFTDNGDGRAFQLLAQWRLGPLNFSARQVHLSDFSSPAFPAGDDPLVRQRRLQVDTVMPLPHGPPLTLSVGGDQERTTSGLERKRIEQRLSLQFGRSTLSNRVSLETSPDAPSKQEGELTFASRRQLTGYRGQLHYRLSPDRRLQRTNVTIDFRPFGNWTPRLRLEHSLEDQRSSVLLALKRDGPHHALTLDTTINDEGGFRFGLLWRASLGHDALAGWYSRSRPLADSGKITARVFLDQDLDGKPGPDEPPLSGVRLLLGSGERLSAAMSDESGRIRLDRLAAYQAIDLRIAPHTLDDPLWQPAVEGWSAIPRPGHAVEVEFAIIPTGEVDGTTYLLADGDRAPVGKVSIEAIDRQGEVAARTESAFDGFYVLSGLRPGKYQLRVTPSQLESLNLKTGDEKTIEITPEEPIVSGQDLVLQKRGDKKAASPIQ